MNLSQLESAGVELSCIRQRFELKNYGGEFAHYLSLSDAFSKSDASNLYDWWRNEGFSTVDKTSKEFSEAREFVLKHFGIDFPEELERLEQQDSEIIQSLRDKPMWLIFKTRSAFLRLNDKWKTKSFVARICNECAKIWEERPKILTKTPKVIVLDKVAKKVGELQTPNGATVELFTVEGNDKIFAHGAQLAVAAGCPNQSGATSDSAGFSKAVNAVAQFYTVRRYNGGKPRRCVDVKDVPDVLNEYAFNQAFDHERYDTAMILLHWWIEQK